MRIHGRRVSPVRATIVIVACFVVSTIGPSLAIAPAGADTASQLSQAQAKLSALLKDIDAATGQRDAVERSLSSLLGRIDTSRRKLESATAQLVDTELRERDAQAQVDRARRLVDQRAAEAYMNPMSSIEVILGSNSFQDLQERVALLGAVGESDDQLLTGLSQEVGTLSQDRSDLDALEQTLQTSQGSLETQATDLKSGLAEQQQAVDRLNRDVAAARGLVSALTDQRARELALEALQNAGGGPGIPPPPAGSSTVRELIVRDFTPLGAVRVTQALCVGAHESGYNPRAVNSSSGAAGVFQFMPQTWPPMSHAAGYGSSSVFDAVANVAVAAWAVAHYGWSPWLADAPFCGF
jgi:peptidoglycan hydrolase CwlO-like protein